MNFTRMKSATYRTNHAHWWQAVVPPEAQSEEWYAIVGGYEAMKGGCSRLLLGDSCEISDEVHRSLYKVAVEVSDRLRYLLSCWSAGEPDFVQGDDGFWRVVEVE